MNKTIIIDIDGTILPHQGNLTNIINHQQNDPLPEVINKFNEWNLKGYYLILITGRKECMRKMTKKQLNTIGLFYDQLIMNAGGGQRILINDLKPNLNEPTALAFNVVRNAGIGNINV